MFLKMIKVYRRLLHGRVSFVCTTMRVREFYSLVPLQAVGQLVHKIMFCILVKLFRKFGDIDNVWLASYPPLFAFVTFKAKEDAADALKEMNNAYVNS